MSRPQEIELTTAEAAALVGQELAAAGRAVQAGDQEAALDGYTRAVGLALQLGPGPVEAVLRAVLGAAGHLARRGDGEGLSGLGPAVVDVVARVRAAGALPPRPAMAAWATLAADVAALLGQLGVALSLAPDHRAPLLAAVRERAARLDAASGTLLALAAWLDAVTQEIEGAAQTNEH